VWIRLMNSSGGKSNVLGELKRAEEVLSNLLERLSEIYNVLESKERRLMADDFSSSGMCIPGSMNAIVCALTADIRGDPLHFVIEQTRGKGLKLPTIIRGSDRVESFPTCDSILKIIKTQFHSSGLKSIINLRWSVVPRIIGNDEVVIIGTRYNHASKADMMRTEERIRELELDVYEDDNEFGGGLLTYQLSRLAEELDGVRVMEITLSSSLASNVSKVAEILEVLSDL
jgi:hypothetical protein